jgi:branched-chain amino acid transport system permease protein
MHVSLVDLWQWLVFGVILGGVYAVAATGLVVTYTTSGIFNFAHGAVGMLAAFSYWHVTDQWGWSPWLGALVVVAFCSPLLGALTERVILRGMGQAPEVTRMVVTIALLVAFLGLAQVLWPTDVGRRTDEFFAGRDTLSLPGDLRVTWQQLLRLITAGAVALGLTWLLKGTRTGIAMRSVVDSRGLARLNGAHPDHLSMFSWAIGFALAAVAGLLIGAGTQLSVFSLTLLVINAYAAALFGRLRSLPRAFGGGIALGVIVTTTQGLLDPAKLTFLEHVPWVTDLTRATPSIVLFIVLLTMPSQQGGTQVTDRIRQYVPLPSWRSALVGAAAVPLVALVVVGLVDGDGLYLRFAANILIFGLLALSLVPLTGYAGQISLAQVGLAGVGAVVMANWELGGPATDVLGLVAAFVVTGAVGALIALPALRLRGIYLALATFAFAVVLDQVVFTQSFAFQGAAVRSDGFTLFGWELATPSSMVVLLAVVSALASLAMVAIRRGPFGRRLQAMKDSPAACATLGISLTRTKFQVFGLSAGIAGLAGALWVAFAVTLPQTSFEPTQNLVLLLMAVAGGVTMVSGSYVAGFLVAGFAFWPAYTDRVAPEFTGFVENIMLLAPGLIGISLGRNPDGLAAMAAKARDARRRVRAAVSPATSGESDAAAGIALGADDAGRDGAGGDGARGASVTVADTDADLGVADLDGGLETLGIDRPFRPADLEEIDAALGLEEVTLRFSEASAAAPTAVGHDGGDASWR